MSRYQVLFLELRKLEKLSEDNVFEIDWLMELVRELIEAVFAWIPNNKEIWDTDSENMMEEHPFNSKQVSGSILLCFPLCFAKCYQPCVLVHFIIILVYSIYFLSFIFHGAVCFGRAISGGNLSVWRILLQQPFVSHKSHEIGFAFSWTKSKKVLLVAIFFTCANCKNHRLACICSHSRKECILVDFLKQFHDSFCVETSARMYGL